MLKTSHNHFGCIGCYSVLCWFWCCVIMIIFKKLQAITLINCNAKLYQERTLCFRSVCIRLNHQLSSDYGNCDDELISKHFRFRLSDIQTHPGPIKSFWKLRNVLCVCFKCTFGSMYSNDEFMKILTGKFDELTG